jgi:hypothetical protein
LLLDDIIPSFDASSRHTIWVAASPSDVYEAARQADLGRPFLVRVLMALRVVPAWVGTAFRARRPPVATIPRQPVGRVRFTLIADKPGEEFVLGIMGRFWTLTGGVVETSAERLWQPPAAGLAQGIWNFHMAPSGAGTMLSTETRVRCGDPATRQRFARYWRVIRPGSGLIRRSMLREIRRRAETRACASQEGGRDKRG